MDPMAENDRQPYTPWEEGKLIFLTELQGAANEVSAPFLEQNEDGKTVAAMDVVAPGIGEIIGGSQREEPALGIGQRSFPTNVVLVPSNAAISFGRIRIEPSDLPFLPPEARLFPESIYWHKLPGFALLTRF